MPFVGYKCCGEDREEFIFPDEVDQRQTSDGKFEVRCDVCGSTHTEKPIMAVSLGKLPAAYGGKTVKEVDAEYAHLEGVKHLERGTLAHRQHLESLREVGEKNAKEAGYKDRRHMRRCVRDRKNIATQRGA